MIGPIMELALVTAAENRSEYPSFFMAGKNIAPNAEVSATADPLSPAKIILDRILTWARVR